MELRSSTWAHRLCTWARDGPSPSGGSAMTTIDHEAFFIGGAWRKAQSDDRFDIISPRSEQIIGHVPAASRADIDDAVAAARQAFDQGEWPRLTPAERADYLTRMADAISKRQEEL